jgi:hypothetical protein
MQPCGQSLTAFRQQGRQRVERKHAPDSFPASCPVTGRERNPARMA